MRKVVAALSFFGILGMLAPPVFAQPPAAPAPAPKVTINGLVDFVATYYNNWSGTGGVGGIQTFDITDGGKDRGFYSRERGVFTLTGEVGRSKGVWAVELDFMNGAGINNTSFSMSGTSANFDLDTDVPGVVETKWLYLETPIFGPGSFLPFVPVSTVLRAGAQPARGHDYKFGIQFSGDFPGVTLETTWAPNLKSTLTYVQIGENLDKQTAPGQTQDWAALLSVEFDVFKGFTVKPTYSFVTFDGGACGTNNVGLPGKGGVSFNVCGAAGPSLNTHRHTIGGDVRWTAGPFSLQPTFLYQFGEQEVRVGGVKRDVDIRAWIFDTIVGFRTGPLNIEARAMYTTGMKAQHQVQNGHDVGYYQAINTGFAYMSGWSDIQTGGVDYITSLFVGNSGLTLRESPSYDKYGRIFFALAADYNLTPALTFRGLTNVSWAAEEVDVNSTIAAATGLTPVNRGDRRFLGWEVAAGLTYRFAPNVAFDLIGSWLITDPFGAESAFAHSRTGGPVRDAHDVYKGTARVRFTF